MYISMSEVSFVNGRLQNGRRSILFWCDNHHFLEKVSYHKFLIDVWPQQVLFGAVHGKINSLSCKANNYYTTFPMVICVAASWIMFWPSTFISSYFGDVNCEKVLAWIIDWQWLWWHGNAFHSTGICVRKQPDLGGFPTQKGYFDVNLNMLNKQLMCRWYFWCQLILHCLWMFSWRIFAATSSPM